MVSTEHDMIYSDGCYNILEEKCPRFTNVESVNLDELMNQYFLGKSSDVTAIFHLTIRQLYTFN